MNLEEIEARLNAATHFRCGTSGLCRVVLGGAGMGSLR